MPFYRWQGMSADGVTVKGVLEAPDWHALNELLLTRGIALLKAREMSPVWLWLQQFMLRQPSIDDCQWFFAHLVAFLQAGVPLKQALIALQGAQPSSVLRKDILLMGTALEQGHSFAAVLAGYGYMPAYVSPLIGGSEQAGTLISALETISEMTLADSEYQKNLRGACFGPAVTIVVALGVLLAVVIFLMPQFLQLYRQCNVKPPAILFVGSFFQELLTFKKICLLLSICATGLLALKKMKKRWSLTAVLALLPGLKHVVFCADMLRWVAVMQAYASSGLPLLDACIIMQDGVHSHQARGIITACIEALYAGRPLSNGFVRYQDNPIVALMAPLIVIGEELGDLSSMLIRIRRELAVLMQEQGKLFNKLIGPVLTVVTGLLIGGLLVMLYLPIMQLGSLIKF
jgi:type II secretory pathway component PulF